MPLNAAGSSIKFQAVFELTPRTHWKANVDGRADSLAEVTIFFFTLFKEIP